MSISLVFPAFLVLAAMMLGGAVLARASGFYRALLEPAKRNRYETLDGLRGFAAAAVVIHHALLYFYEFSTGVWGMPGMAVYKLFGKVAIAVFFMLTGFLFWGKVLADKGRFDLQHHIRGRLTRLAPMYIFAATLISVMTLVSIWPIESPLPKLIGTFARIYGLGIIDWTTIEGVKPLKMISGVVWTLKYEWVFYTLIPILAFFRHPRWLALLVVAYLAENFATTAWHKALGPSMDLIGGMIAAQLVHSNAFSRVRWNAWYMSVLALAGLAVLPLLVHAKLEVFNFSLILFFFFTVVKGNSMFGILTASGPKTIGTVSYSLYLLHGPVLYLSQPAMRLFSVDDATCWVAITIVALIAIAISAVTYRWIEHPFMEMERHRRKVGVPPTRLRPIYAWPNKELPTLAPISPQEPVAA